MAASVFVSYLRQKGGWYVRRGPSEIVKMLGYQYAIDGGISTDIVLIGIPIGLAVVRVDLMPWLFRRGPIVDVVAHHHLPAPVPYGAFIEVVGMGPVLVEAYRICSLHREYAAPGRLKLRTAHAKDPVTDIGGAANFWLAGRQRTGAVERVGSKPEIACDDVNINP